MSDIPENINSEEQEKQDSDEVKPEESTETEKKVEIPDSNYQISLVNDNLLRIVLKTDKSVGVDCFIKDKSGIASEPSQTNKITIHPTPDGKQHEIEIVVSINPEGGVNISTPQIINKEEEPKSTEEPVKKKLLIDPALSDLVEKQSQIDKVAIDIPKSWEELYQDRLTLKNKYKINRKLMDKNIKTGFIISLLIFFSWAFITFGIDSSDKKNEDIPPEVRMLTIEDLPEMKVDVPLTEKQKEELEKQNSGDNTPSSTPKVTIPSRRVIRTPKIVTSKDSLQKDTNIADMNDELDRQRRGGDTSGTGIIGQYDSTKVYINVAQVGWILIDSSTVSKMNISIMSNDSIAIYIDTAYERDFSFQVLKRGVDAEAEIEKAIKNGRPFKDFILNDPSYRGYITYGPKSSGGTVDYNFMIKNDITAILIYTSTSDNIFAQFQPKIEAVIKSIRLPSKK